MSRLFLLFTIIPLVELWLLLQLGRVVGFWPTVLGVVITALVGAHLGRREGLRVFWRWRDSIAAGRLPEEGVLSGVLVLVGGVLLVTPGVLTDVAGLLLLVPASRRIVARLLRREIERRIRMGTLRVVTHRTQRTHGSRGPRKPGRPAGRASDQVIESRPVEDGAGKGHEP